MTQHGQPNELCPQDQRLLDALVDCRFDREAMGALTPDQQRRVDSLVSLFELLGDYPVEDADESLVHATLARVDRCEEQRASRMAFSEAAEANELPARSRFRMPDFVSIAAVILIGASIVWPLTSHLNDFDGAMPIAQAGMFSNWNTTRHNTVNLDPLLQGGYCDRSYLNCPGHKGPYGESYSYQWHVPGHRMIWGVDRVTLMLGDRNPLIDGARAGQWLPALTISLNHGGRGQNVLSTDGRWAWFVEPVFGHNDNIWWKRPSRGAGL
ncbi:MAG: hypothetical protein ACYTA3_14105 [Planctomycetota bacterium]|jgi:hypothetical protein